MPDPLTPPEIQSIRESHGWTQAEMAAACGVNIRTVQDWLSGRKPPSNPSLVLLRRLRDEAGRGVVK